MSVADAGMSERGHFPMVQPHACPAALAWAGSFAYQDRLQACRVPSRRQAHGHAGWNCPDLTLSPLFRFPWIIAYGLDPLS